MANNTEMHQARRAKEDEFYTRRIDIENELKNYKDYFKGKVVYCNCDDPRKSKFFDYFAERFESLGLKKLITTCYQNKNPMEFSNHDSEKAIYLVYEGDKNKNRQVDDDEVAVKPLKGDGDFRSEECIAMLREADIVVTNPPFSLFREYVAQLVEFEKKFLIIGNLHAITYKEIFPFIRDNKMWVGYNLGRMEFRIPDHYPARKSRFWIDDKGQKWRSMGNTCWFTNLPTKKRSETLPLIYDYNPEDYPDYDNFDAIEVKQTKLIPKECDRVMGVPITFIDKLNPKQFEIVGLTNHSNLHGGVLKEGQDNYVPMIDGKRKYIRVLIRRK